LRRFIFFTKILFSFSLAKILRAEFTQNNEIFLFKFRTLTNVLEKRFAAHWILKEMITRLLFDQEIRSTIHCCVFLSRARAKSFSASSLIIPYFLFCLLLIRFDQLIGNIKTRARISHMEKIFSRPAKGKVIWNSNWNFRI
jgi:hypothetical protein